MLHAPSTPVPLFYLSIQHNYTFPMILMVQIYTFPMNTWIENHTFLKKTDDAYFINESLVLL